MDDRLTQPSFLRPFFGFAVLVFALSPVHAELARTEGIAYEIKGTGCPLVLIGGGSAMDARQFAAARDQLAAQFQTISIDPRGIGRSENPKAPYADADDMVAVLDHLGLSAALFVGGSAAGATVLEVALAHPDRMIGGVAIAPFLAGFEPSPAMAERFQRFGRAVNAGGDAFVDLVRDDPHFLPAPERPDVRETAWALIRETFSRPSADASLARQPEPPVIARLAEIVPPFLVAAGELDHADISRRLDLLEEKVSGIRRVKIPNAGHTAAMENPDAFVTAVLPFLRGLDCRGSSG